MALVVKDRVRETTTSTGTGTITLAGAVLGFQSFAVIGNTNTTYYTIVDGATGDWEVGIGTYTSSGLTLSRDTVLESSNSGSLVNFAAGTKDVFCAYPAERSIYTDAAGSVITPATASTLAVVNGGTGATTLTGYVKGTGTSALTASSTIPNTDISGLGTMSTQNSNSVAVTGGTIDGTSIGATAASTGAFTTLSASSTVSGTGFSTYLASPPAIGGTTAAAGSFTTLTTSSTTTLNGGTANGVAYLNASKALTTGSALTFNGTDLVLGGSTPSGGFKFSEFVSASATPVNAFRITNGSDATFDVLLQTSLASIGTGIGDLAFLRQGSEQMRLTSTGLGIGTSSPSFALDVQGSAANIARFTSSGASTSFSLNNTNANAWGSNLAILTGGTAAGYFGTIGSLLGNTTQDLAVYATASNGFRVYTNGNNERMRIDSSGNLGLGVTPSAWSSFSAMQLGPLGGLSLAGAIDNSFISSNAYYGSGSFRFAATGYVATAYRQVAGAHTWSTTGATAGTAGNAISFTQAMTLDASGNLGIGTSSPGQKLDVVGTIRSTNFIGNNGAYTLYNNSDNTNYYYIQNGGATGSANPVLSFIQGGVAERMRIDSSGNLGLGGAPSAFGAGRYLQFVGVSAVGQQANGTADFMCNAYESSANAFSYVVSAGAARYNVTAGTHAWYTAPSGTAGNAITFTQAATLTAAGDFLVGRTTATFATAGRTSIEVNGTSDSIVAFGASGNAVGYLYASATEARVASLTSVPLTFFTNNTERARIHASGGVSIGNTTDPGAANLSVTGAISGGYTALAAGTTAMGFAGDNVVRVTPNATATYTTTVPVAGAICVLSILTSGTSSYTITFGTGFKATGTLATGTVSARYFQITFVSDGTNLLEMSRTTAIA